MGTLAPPGPEGRVRGDAIGYVLPTAIFLVLTWVGAQLPGWYAATYALKTVLVAGALWLFRRSYSPISGRHLGLGAAVGIGSALLWIGSAFLMRSLEGESWHRAAPFDPFAAFHSPLELAAFLVVRAVGAVAVVPFMEELFWRDFLWRAIASPGDFRRVPVGAPDWTALVFVSLSFAVSHSLWPIALAWGLLIAALLWGTRSLGACIAAHAATNAVLAGWVLLTRDWSLWS